MEPVKVIPCLDMKDGRVVKGVHFVGLRDAGDPVENARFYREAGADEVTMLDIAATVEGRGTRLAWARDVAAALGDVPLTVGGGISSLEDIAALVDVGVAKVSMNSAAVRRPELVREAATAYGSGRVVVAIDGRRNPELPSGFEVVVSGGQKGTGLDCVEWARACEDLGAGALSCRRPWTGTARSPATTSRSPVQWPTPSPSQSSRPVAPAHSTTSVRPWSTAGPPPSSPPPCSTSAPSACAR